MPTYYSSEDMLGLMAELNAKRLPRILGELTKRTGGMMPVTPAENELLVKIRTLHAQYMRGDLTHTDNDESRIKACMDWLVVQHSTQRGHPPRLDYPWDPAKLRRKEPAPNDTYRRAMEGTHQW